MVMDAPSQFIFNLEKRNGQIKMIHSLASKSGEPAELKTYAVDFYGHLYKSEHKEYFFFLWFYSVLPKAQPDPDTSPNAVPAEEHQFDAVQGLQSGKAPATDGLPADFYFLVSRCRCSCCVRVAGVELRLSSQVDCSLHAATWIDDRMKLIWMLAGEQLIFNQGHNEKVASENISFSILTNSLYFPVSTPWPKNCPNLFSYNP